jgi:hypothetical protein
MEGVILTPFLVAVRPSGWGEEGRRRGRFRGGGAGGGKTGGEAENLEELDCIHGLF